MIEVLAPPAEPTWALAAAPPAGKSWRRHRLIRGRPQDPAWARPALVALLVLTAVLYLLDLGASGWANSFYAAAVQAGTKSWKAFFFGSSDASNFITVDKPPASLWVMEISARIFGLSSWSLLAPQALEGVATVATVYFAVRRWFGAAAATLAGAAMAVTPVAVLMFRFNNPDALLVLLLTLGTYCVIRSLEGASWRWITAAFLLLGVGFITKELQAFLVAPAFAFAYLASAPTSFWTRVRHLALAGVGMVVSSGWWVAVVQLWPASDRPYIGGSTDNSFLNQMFGYNGFGRITGNEAGSVGGGGFGGAARGAAAGLPGATTGTTASRWGITGLTRMFSADMGSQISWLLPTALLLLVACLWITLRSRRTDRLKASVILWGLSLLVTAGVLSFGQGIIHPYYTVALAPSIAALSGIGAKVLWTRRHLFGARAWLAATVAVTALWDWELLRRSPTWHPLLRNVVVVVGAMAALALLVDRGVAHHRRHLVLSGLAGGTAVAALAAGPAAYALQTAGTAHTGSIPSAGPAVNGSGPGGFGGPGGAFGRLGGFGRFGRFGGAGGFPGFGGGSPGAGVGGPAGGFPGFGRAPGGGFGGGQGRAGGAGGLLQASRPSAAITKALQAHASKYRWVAAAIGSNNASGYQLATGDPVMAIGGFNGTDPSPTLAQFERYVASGDIHYFIAGGGFGAGLGTTANYSGAITSWVESRFRAQTIGGVTLYDLTAGRS